MDRSNLIPRTVRSQHHHPKLRLPDACRLLYVIDPTFRGERIPTENGSSDFTLNSLILSLEKVDKTPFLEAVIFMVNVQKYRKAIESI